MKKSTYLKIIGTLELIAFVILLFVYILAWGYGAISIPGATSKSMAIILGILYLVLFIFFGPAIGVLFLTVADLVERSETNDTSKNDYSKKEDAQIREILKQEKKD